MKIRFTSCVKRTVKFLQNYDPNSIPTDIIKVKVINEKMRKLLIKYFKKFDVDNVDESGAIFAQILSMYQDSSITVNCMLLTIYYVDKSEFTTPIKILTLVDYMYFMENYPFITEIIMLKNYLAKYFEKSHKILTRYFILLDIEGRERFERA